MTPVKESIAAKTMTRAIIGFLVPVFDLIVRAGLVPAMTHNYWLWLRENKKAGETPAFVSKATSRRR
jgi:hypothetical protein